MYPHLVLSSETQVQAQIALGAVEEILLGANPAERGVRAGPGPAEPGLPTPHAPADAALLAVVLLLVTVKQVADVAVVLAKEAATALAALLGLRGQEHPECCIQCPAPRGAWSLRATKLARDWSVSLMRTG